MAQQAAVEWLEKQFDKYTSGGVNVPNNKIFKLTEKAKAMEADQSDRDYQQGFSDGYSEGYDKGMFESQQQSKRHRY